MKKVLFIAIAVILIYLAWGPFKTFLNTWFESQAQYSLW
jgi:hypothetical protein